MLIAKLPLSTMDLTVKEKIDEEREKNRDVV